MSLAGGIAQDSGVDVTYVDDVSLGSDSGGDGGSLSDSDANDSNSRTARARTSNSNNDSNHNNDNDTSDGSGAGRVSADAEKPGEAGDGSATPAARWMEVDAKTRSEQEFTQRLKAWVLAKKESALLLRRGVEEKSRQEADAVLRSLQRTGSTSSPSHLLVRTGSQATVTSINSGGGGASPRHGAIVGPRGAVTRRSTSMSTVHSASGGGTITVSRSPVHVRDGSGASDGERLGVGDGKRTKDLALSEVPEQKQQSQQQSQQQPQQQSKQPLQAPPLQQQPQQQHQQQQEQEQEQPTVGAKGETNTGVTETSAAQGNGAGTSLSVSKPGSVIIRRSKTGNGVRPARQFNAIRLGQDGYVPRPTAMDGVVCGGGLHCVCISALTTWVVSMAVWRDRYFQRCKELGINPEAIGCVLDPNFSGTTLVDLSNYGLGDAVAQAISASLPNLLTLRTLVLSASCNVLRGAPVAVQRMCG